MTREEFQKLTQDVVLLDGATGSNLMAAGMPRGICTEAWIMEHKEVLQNLQKAYVEAGSQIVYAPTFGGNRYSLGLHGLQDKLAEMNHALVNISREAVGHKVYVAGDITTTGKMMEPAGDLTYEMAYETYCEQIKVLSLGTNDLSQYTLAMDRQNPLLRKKYNDHHPAVLRMIQMVIEAGHAENRRVCICGELAADTALTEEFLRMGVDCLSVVPACILPVRKALRQVDLSGDDKGA